MILPMVARVYSLDEMQQAKLARVTAKHRAWLREFAPDLFGRTGSAANLMQIYSLKRIKKGLKTLAQQPCATAFDRFRAAAFDVECSYEPDPDPADYHPDSLSAYLEELIACQPSELESLGNDNLIGYPLPEEPLADPCHQQDYPAVGIYAHSLGMTPGCVLRTLPRRPGAPANPAA